MSDDTKSKKKKVLRPKGSIVYEILVVLLVVALYFTISYPAKVWDTEKHNTNLCRENMWHIYWAEITYLDDSLVYADTLSHVVNHILDDTTHQNLRLFTKLDTTLGNDVINFFHESDYRMTINTDSLVPDSLVEENADSVMTVQKEVQVKTLIDSLWKYAKKFDLDTTETFILDSLRSVPEFSQKIDSFALVTLKNMSRCPTTSELYEIKAFNDTTPKFVNIYCPIDSSDVDSIRGNFKLHVLGGLNIENHGGLETGEKTWDQ
ncbi:MAG: hypothetical protein U5R06_17435 [candidate division KSB1 bacterium]|nr:hypothetical protein [candidate division KSB1 bacterium]